ncbi:MAG: HNH endonuclease signature motif containing protein [Pseudomonadota bacterium]
MPLLYFWRWDNYQRDLGFGGGYHLNQRSSGLHRIALGESLWAFTRRPDDGAYVLVAELIAKARTINHPRLAREYRYGPYRLWGDLRRSRYFLPQGQPPIDQVIRSLSLDVRTSAIGRSFQGPGAVRSITAADSALLAQVANQLQPDHRARLYPEDRFTALAIAGGADEVERLMAAESSSPEERWEYHYGPARALVKRRTGELRGRYRDRCQLCGWSGLDSYGHEVCEAHHMHWLSRGGPDTLENLVLLCPNHHRVIHRSDAVFDYQDNAFVFDERHREALRLVGHLGA